jgi:CheY-like chemotaxis protein
MTNIPILVVEDDLLSSLECCESLRERGFDVFEVSGALGAYGILDRKLPLAALLTDINLGPGADGYEIARYARDIYPNLAVVYLSGSCAQRIKVEGVARSEFVSKPYDRRLVMAALERTIHLELNPVPPLLLAS